MGGTVGTFHGATVITLDAKGRLAVPTRHREALVAASRTLVLTAHPDGCALIYPESAWERVRTQVEKFPSFHPQASWWKRLLLGFEEHIAPDASGRLSVADRAAADRALADLGARLGVTQAFRRDEPDGAIIEWILPREVYLEFVRGLAGIGRWTADREPAALPARVRLQVRVGS